MRRARSVPPLGWQRRNQLCPAYPNPASAMSRSRTSLIPAAVTEFREIAQYYEEGREGKGEEFTPK